MDDLKFQELLSLINAAKALKGDIEDVERMIAVGNTGSRSLMLAAKLGGALATVIMSEGFYSRFREFLQQEVFVLETAYKQI